MSARLSTAVILCVTAATVAAQSTLPVPESPQDPVFRTGVESVDVDVVVTDRKGNFVRGLTADDFEVFEDRVPQDVTTFSFVDLPTSRMTGAAGDRALDEAGVAEGRRFIMVLNGHGPRLARIAWLFVDQALGANDEAAVYYQHPVSNAFVEGQSFTASKPRLRAAIRTVEPAFRPFQPRTLPPIGFLDRRQMEDERARIALEKYEVLERAMEEIAATPGRRKAVLWFGGDLPFSYSGTQGLQLALAYRDVIRAAARHHVVIYPIDPRGLTTRRGARELMRMGALRALAEDTGVEAIVGTNDYEKGYARIVREMSTYYLLGYYPRVRHHDGRFHAIRVRVKRPDVSVRARKGYFAEEPLPNLPEAPRPPEAVEAALGVLADSVSTIDFRDDEAIEEVPATRPEPSALGQATLWRRGSLPRDPYVRAVDPRFTRQQRLRLEMPTNAEQPVTARLLDRLGAPLPLPAVVSERPDPSGGFRWIVVDLTLAPLAQADYALEVTQGDAVRVTAFRVVP
jgi:VWFA-related protein